MAEKPYTAAFYTLGCRVNQYETRAVEEAFMAKGFAIGSFEEPCDVYVINTCTVTAESDRKSRQLIRRARKIGGKNAIVMAMGCMVQTSPRETARILGLDYAVGNREKLTLADVAWEMLAGKKPDVRVHTGDDASFPDRMRVTGSDNTRAFLKIADGCDNRCSYCIIPTARGTVRSKLPQAVCEEVCTLVRNGCREVVFTGIETAAYGKDLADTDLVSLIGQVEALDDACPDRIRLGSLEPTVLKPERVRSFAAFRHMMPHYHLSLQSGSDAVLAAMRRKYNTRMFYEVLCDLRRTIPDVTVTTDIIVGFPGETEEMFEQTVDFVRKCAFLFVHIFPYSDRAGTEASRMSGKIGDAEKKRRAARLKEVMLDVRRKVLSAYIGTERTVLVETVTDGVAAGHTDNFIETSFAADGQIPVTVNRLVTVRLTGISADCTHMQAELLHLQP